MTDRIQYVDSDGRVPRDLTTAEGADVLRQLVLTRMVLDRGGRVEVLGFKTETEISVLLSYELRVAGSGHGSMIIEAIPKGGPE